jgi:hypothetical protein
MVTPSRLTSSRSSNISRKIASKGALLIHLFSFIGNEEDYTVFKVHGMIKNTIGMHFSVSLEIQSYDLPLFVLLTGSKDLLGFN